MEFSSNLSAIYTKSCTQSFPPIFEHFKIFERNFAKIVTPHSNKNKYYLVHLKGKSMVKNGVNSIKIAGMLKGREFQGQGQGQKPKGQDQEPQGQKSQGQGQGQGQRSRPRSNSIVMACNCSLVQNSINPQQISKQSCDALWRYQ